jgi:competence protein ComEC
VLHLGGLACGGALSSLAPAPWAAAPIGWGRVTLLTPLLAAGTGGPGAALAGLATFGLAGGWGWGEATARGERADAVAPSPWDPAVAVGMKGRALLRVSGWAAPTGDGRWRAPARVLAFTPDDGDDTGIAPGVGVMVTGRGDLPGIGQAVAAKVRLTRPRGAGIEGGFDYRHHLAARDLEWTARADSIHLIAPAPGDLAAIAGVRGLGPIQATLRSGLDRILPPREASLSASVILGSRDPGNRELSRPFTDLGLVHLFSVGGLHVGILLALLLAPARAAGLGPVFAAVPVLCVLAPYAVITGLPTCVIRAAGAGALALAAPCLGRRLDTLRTLGLLYALCIAWDPRTALDTGLRLSYIAAAGILAVSRATDGLRFSGRRPWSWLGTGVAVTLAAQWATLPVTAHAFGRLSLVSPLANLVAVPLFGVAVWATVVSLALVAIVPAAGLAGGALAWLLWRAMAAAVSWCAAQTPGWEVGMMPMSPSRVLLWAVLTVALLVMLARFTRAHRPGRAMLLLSCSAVAGPLLAVVPARAPWSAAEVTLHVLDVGQGDCGLVAFPDGWRVLLDTAGVYGGRGATEGPFTREVLPWLHRAGIRRLDDVVLTHGHRDHTGGARAAAAALRVDRWWCGGRASRALAGLPDSARARVDPPPTVLHRWRGWEAVLMGGPDPAAARTPENDCSLVLVLRQDNQVRLVWSGDLEVGGEERLLAAHPELGRAGAWKAGHHGSDTSGGPPWLSRLEPEVVLVSCGVGNRYGHPSHGPYVAAGDTLAVHRTDVQGSLVVRWDPRTGKRRVSSAWPLPGRFRSGSP